MHSGPDLQSSQRHTATFRHCGRLFKNQHFSSLSVTLRKRIMAQNFLSPIFARTLEKISPQKKKILSLYLKKRQQISPQPEVSTPAATSINPAAAQQQLAFIQRQPSSN